ncbi:MAG TPA: hypothetical protein VIL04_03485 [Solirubrobacterales bacterium]
MNRLIILVGLAAILGVGAFAALPTQEAEAISIKKLAKRECREERRTDRQDFIRKYGGTGKAALRRCIKDERRDARRDCRSERREEPQEFRNEYGGTGKAALRRCIKDEIR